MHSPVLPKHAERTQPCSGLHVLLRLLRQTLRHLSSCAAATTVSSKHPERKVPTNLGSVTPQFFSYLQEPAFKIHHGNVHSVFPLVHAFSMLTYPPFTSSICHLCQKTGPDCSRPIASAGATAPSPPYRANQQPGLQEFQGPLREGLACSPKRLVSLAPPGGNTAAPQAWAFFLLQALFPCLSASVKQFPLFTGAPWQAD